MTAVMLTGVPSPALATLICSGAMYIDWVCFITIISMSSEDGQAEVSAEPVAFNVTGLAAFCWQGDKKIEPE
jgi:hypothetical protein